MNLEELGSTLAHDVAGEILHGVSIIRGMHGADYKLVGAQFRHNLDFVNAFLNGLTDRRVDYNARRRDPQIEAVANYATEQMLVAVHRFEGLSPDVLHELISVRSEINEDRWHTSSVSRELEFLHSHTIHHHALIAKILSSAGCFVDDDLGVAPSTLRFRASIDRAFAGS